MKSVKFWYLYDFANSFASAVLIFYFPLMFVERGYSDNYIGIATVISTVILLLSYPHLGQKSDHVQSLRMKYVRISSAVMLISLATIAYLNNFVNTFISGYLMLLGFILFQVAFQGSYVFYSAQLQEFEESGHNKDRLSSLGIGFGQLGNAITIGLAGYLLSQNVTLVGFSDKSLIFILGGTAFLFLALPYLLQRDTVIERKIGSDGGYSVLSSARQLFKKLKDSKRVLYFLLGYTLIADSVFTLQVYASLYFKKVYNMSDVEVSTALAVSLFSLFLTCMLVGHLSDKIKSEQKFLLASAVLYAISFINLGFAPDHFVYLVVSLSVAGIAYGLFFPSARAYYSNLIPSHSQGEFFSIFVIFERAATIVGPLQFVAVLAVTSSFDISISYRLAVISLAVLALFGTFFLKSHTRYAPMTLKQPLTV